MDDLFPEMLDRPDNGRVAASAIYWPICYMLIPFVSTLLVMGPNSDVSITSVVDIAYYIINAVVMIGLFLQYIKDSLLNVQINGKGFFKTVAVTSGIMVFLALGIMAVSFRAGLMQAMSLFPITETSVLAYPAVLVMDRPVLGLLCTVLLNPVTVSCMFYATAFAPFACNHPRLAYLYVALALLIPRVFNMWWLGYAYDELLTHFIQLPFHLLACWTYQKTDTIWAPMITISIVNLVNGVFLLMMQAAGMIWLA